MTEIHGEVHVQELARMLSGAEVTPAVRRHTQQLLQSGAQPATQPGCRQRSRGGTDR